MKNTRSLIRKLIITLSIASVIGGGVGTYHFMHTSLDHRSTQLSLEQERWDTLNRLADNHEYQAKYLADMNNLNASFLNGTISATEYEKQKNNIGSLDYIEEFFLNHGNDNAKKLINDLNSDIRDVGDKVFKNTIGAYVSLATPIVVPFSLYQFYPKKKDDPTDIEDELTDFTDDYA